MAQLQKGFPMKSIEKIEKAPCIFLYKDFFDVKNFIELAEKESEKSWAYLDWSSSVTGDGNDRTESEYRSSLEMNLDILLQDEVIDDLKEISNLFKSIFLDIDKCIYDYRNVHDLMLQKNESFALLKYNKGGQYHSHHDHSSQNSRVLSMVASFGEAEEGGELEFPYFNLKIKLEKNSLLLFPSNFPYTHIAHPVENGFKYSLVTWFI